MTLRRKRGGLRRTPLRRVPLAAAKHEREERERQRAHAKRAKRAAARTERDERRAADEELLAASREIVLRESRGVCQRCHRERRLEVHHLVPRARAPRWPGLHETPNLAALCRGCHRAIHAAAVPDWRRWILPPPSGTWSRTG